MVEKTFDGGEAFLGAALDHVAGKGPGGGGEAEDGNVGAYFFYSAAKSFHEEAGLAFRVKSVEFFYIGLAADRFREVRAGIAEFEREAHGFGRDKNVREDDNCINAEAAEGLEGDFDSKVGGLADLQKGVLGANVAIFGEVAASLTHHPNGKARHRFAAAGAEKQLFTGNSEFRMLHKYIRQDNKGRGCCLYEMRHSAGAVVVGYTGDIFDYAQDGEWRALATLIGVGSR